MLYFCLSESQFDIKSILILSRIRVIGAAGNQRYARIGDVIVAVIKDALPQMPLERSEVIRAVIVPQRPNCKSGALPTELYPPRAKWSMHERVRCFFYSFPWRSWAILDLNQRPRP